MAEVQFDVFDWSASLSEEFADPLYTPPEGRFCYLC